MFKPLIAPIVAASLALTPIAAAPAQAGSDDVAKSLAGLALLAIIGSAIAADGAGASPVTTPRRYVTPPRYYPPKVVKPVTPPRRHVKPSLPGKCREALRIGGKTRNFFSKGCLDQNFRGAHRLPTTCKSTINVFGRNRQVYAAGCLRNAGWPV